MKSDFKDRLINEYNEVFARREKLRKFYYIKNNMGDVYTIPLLNILYTLRKER